jgi:hypothetical protein
MKKLRMLLALIVVGTVGVSLLSRVLLEPTGVVSEYYSETAVSVVLIDALFAMGAAVLFLLALKHFKPELKPAYRLMALSTLGVGLALLVFPYIEYRGLWENLWWNMSSYLQYLIGAPLMYFGVRQFYKRMGLSGWEAALLTLVLLIVALSAVHMVLPMDYATYWPFSEMKFNLFKLVTIIPIAAYALTAYMAFRLRLRAGGEYAGAFTWLSIGMLFYVVANTGVALIELIGYENAYYSSRYYTIPSIVGDIALLLAGYCFAAIGRPRDTVVKRGETVTSMDIIIYAADKASDKNKLESFLDDMRLVTSHVHPGEVPNADDQKKLKGVYLNIENFLLASDPLRTFKKDELRADIERHFSLADREDKNNTFWPSL